MLKWDETEFVLKKPDGRAVLALDVARAHRALEFNELYTYGRIRFSTPEGPLSFKGKKKAVAALREFVAEGLRSDAEYRTHLRGRALRAIPIGLALFVAGAGPFALFCWFASWAPDPPPGHWIEWLGGLIHTLLCALLGVAIWGLCMACLGFQRWRLVRRVEREQ